LDLKDVIITPDTDKALIPFIRAYQSPGRVPCRQELLDVQYDDTFYQTTGHCTLKGLALQAGYDADDYVKELRRAERMMSRAMDDNDA